MHPPFEAFIDRSKALALAHGLHWHFSYDEHGKVPTSERWNISKLRGSAVKPTAWLGVVSTFGPSLPVLEKFGRADLANDGVVKALPPAWIELFKALIIHDQLVRFNKPANSIGNLGATLRILATCAGDQHPSELSAETVDLAFHVALFTGESAKRGALMKGFLGSWFDGYSLSKSGSLAAFCTPSPRYDAAAQFAKLAGLTRQQSDYARVGRFRSELSQRRAAERLPDEDSFWELVRIVFTEAPLTFSDAIRFAQFKLLILTGLRVGELVSLPANALVKKEHLLPGDSGELIKKEVFVLRHFAEKREEVEGPTGVVLQEAFQDVPDLFQEMIESIIADVLRLTAPLRATVSRQAESGRYFPDADPTALVPGWDAYRRLSGTLQIAARLNDEALERQYRSTFDIKALRKLRADQEMHVGRRYSPNIGKYFHTLEQRLGRGIRRNSIGELIPRTHRGSFWILVSDMEAFVAEFLPTKVSDLQRVYTSTGDVLFPQDFLFLYPGRALGEGRLAGITDVESYFSVARSQPKELSIAGGPLFARYSKGKFKGLNPHSLRHLQNTELFRQGVSDAIITKRFNRNSPAQSYVYDHRSLQEHLDAMDVPRAIQESLGPKAQQAYVLIVQKKIAGPVVERFKRLQATEGDEAAFQFLNAEVGALHHTPYGFCINSFAVNPCPKHLECFNGCGHLVRSERPEETGKLVEMRDRLKAVLDRAEVAPGHGPRFELHVRHARQRYEGVVAALASAPGERVFPGGDDLHVPPAPVNWPQ